MPTETVKADPELRRAKGLLKLQQETQQGGADVVKILAISRLIQAIPANTLAQARSEMAMSAPANPSPGGPAAAAASVAQASPAAGPRRPPRSRRPTHPPARPSPSQRPSQRPHSRPTTPSLPTPRGRPPSTSRPTTAACG